MAKFRIWEGYSDIGGGKRWEHSTIEAEDMNAAAKEVKSWIRDEYRNRIEDTLSDEDMAFIEVTTFFDSEGNEVTPDKLPDDWEEKDYSYRNEFYQIDRITARGIR